MKLTCYFLQNMEARKHRGFAEYRPEVDCSVNRLLLGHSMVVFLSPWVPRFNSKPVDVGIILYRRDWDRVFSKYLSFRVSVSFH